MAVELELQGRVAVLTLNRREALNAFNSEQLQALLDRIDEIENNPNVRVAVVTGSGSKAFAAGADIKEMQQKSPDEARSFAYLGHEIGRRIEGSRLPFIAAVNGYAFGGGCELALSCDMRLASENAVFAQPEVGLGIPPGWGATQRLPRLIGEGMAAEMIYSGRWVKADEALRIGLVNSVHQDGELLDASLSLARSIAANSPSAVAASKRAIKQGVYPAGNAGLMYETHEFALLFDTEEQREGMTAFIEKRKPSFSED